MNKQRMAVAGLGALGIIGTLLPWASLSGVISINGLQAGWTGLLVALLSIAAIVLAFMGDKQLTISNPLYIMIIGGVLALISILQIFNTGGYTGIGLYVDAIAGIALAAVPKFIKF